MRNGTVSFNLICKQIIIYFETNQFLKTSRRQSECKPLSWNWIILDKWSESLGIGRDRNRILGRYWMFGHYQLFGRNQIFGWFCLPKPKLVANPIKVSFFANQEYCVFGCWARSIYYQWFFFLNVTNTQVWQRKMEKKSFIGLLLSLIIQYCKFSKKKKNQHFLSQICFFI